MTRDGSVRLVESNAKRRIQMSQNRLHSLRESCISTAIGFVLAYAINLTILPAMHRSMTTPEIAFWFTMLMTVISIIRQYFVRRLFNWLSHHRSS